MLKVYISSPVSHYQRPSNLRVANTLRSAGINVCLPQEIAPPKTKHKKFEYEVFNKCVNMIHKSDLGLLLYPYGRDSAWEAGYYLGLNKPMFALLTSSSEKQISRLRDWMIKGGLNAIITTSDKAYKILKSDPILSSKDIALIKSVENLPGTITDLYEKSYSNNEPVFVGVGAVVANNDKVLLVQETDDSPFYMREKGMWGFPTTTMSDNPPEVHSIHSLKKEANLDGTNPSFICKQTIPNAAGLFYKLDVDKYDDIENARWFPFDQVLSSIMNLRPTFENVLKIYLD